VQLTYDNKIKKKKRAGHVGCNTSYSGSGDREDCGPRLA
jgi:hypothetical protein